MCISHKLINYPKLWCKNIVYELVNESKNGFKKALERLARPTNVTWFQFNTTESKWPLLKTGEWRPAPHSWGNQKESLTLLHNVLTFILYLHRQLYPVILWSVLCILCNKVITNLRYYLLKGARESQNVELVRIILSSFW